MVQHMICGGKNKPCVLYFLDSFPFCFEVCILVPALPLIQLVRFEKFCTFAKGCGQSYGHLVSQCPNSIWIFMEFCSLQEIMLS